VLVGAAEFVFVVVAVTDMLEGTLEGVAVLLGVVEGVVVVEVIKLAEALMVVIIVVTVELTGAETGVVVTGVTENEIEFPMEARAVHCDEEGIGCGSGVAGWPWKNVEVPYTPMGSPLSPLHCSKTPGA